MTDIPKLKLETANTHEWSRTTYTSVCIADGLSELNETKNRHAIARIVMMTRKEVTNETRIKTMSLLRKQKNPYVF